MNNVITATVVDADGEVVGTREVAPLPSMLVPPNATQGQMGSVAIQAHALATQKLGEIMAAKASPRDLKAIEREILAECKDPIFAEKAIYAKPVGGGFVEGLGIFFAKHLYSIYSNLQYETVEHSKSIKDGTQVQCTIWDKQTNNTRSETIIILHSKNSGGNMVALTDPEAIRLEGSRQKSYLERNCLFDCFNPGLLQKCFEQVIQTLDKASSAAMADPKETLEKYSKKFGVSFLALCAFLNIKNEKALKPMHCRRLLAIYKLIESGESTVEKLFGKPGLDLEAESKKEDEKLAAIAATEATQTIKPSRSSNKPGKGSQNVETAESTQTAKEDTTRNASVAESTPTSEKPSTQAPAPSVQSADRDDLPPVEEPAKPIKPMALPDNF